MTFSTDQFSLPTDYQNFIHISRYARFLPDLGRRETYPETVGRYFDFMQNHLINSQSYDPQLFQEQRISLEKAMLNLEIMPSMRALMTAGDALARDNTCSFNCSFLPFEHPRCFDECMFILLCGTGVGFSDERQYINQLPEIPAEFKSGAMVKIKDSKEGWASGFREILNELWKGRIPKWNTNEVRPAGAILKTFGGRASGPEPLEELFRFVTMIFQQARGRKLNSIEVHDIACKIGDIVVCGGVRRSAMISLSNLSDDRMRSAKSGEWYNLTPWRRLANNSVAYTEKPDVGSFMREWNALYESKSGERGIFNREGARKSIERNGRRDPDHQWGINPCLTYESRLLTDKGLQKIGDLATNKIPFKVFNGDKEYAPATAWKTGTKEVFKVTLVNGLSFRATGNHVVEMTTQQFPSSDNFTKPVKMKVEDLEVGMKMRSFLGTGDWTGETPVDSDTATAYGYLFGDGYRDGNRLSFMCSEPEVVDFMSEVFGDRMIPKTTKKGYYQLQGIRQEAEELGFSFAALPERKFPECVLTWSSDLVKAFLKGVFSANGCFFSKHNRISLKATNKYTVDRLQELLIALGYSTHTTTNKSQDILWENGIYTSKESYNLNVSGYEPCRLFKESIGFLHHHKMVKGKKVKPRTGLHRSSSIASIESDGVEDVFDFNEPTTNWGWVNGLKIHNCGEIFLRPYQLCNLSEVMIRKDDNIESLERKVQQATILGTWQSSLTYFPYLRSIWKDNTEEERLLGVSLTGQADNILMSGRKGNYSLRHALNHLKQTAITQNKITANDTSINISTAITCVKPSGTVSQLVDAASGMHERHAPYYIRTVRGDNKDPITQFMIDNGIPHEPDQMAKNTTTVFSFPMKSPDGAVLRNDRSAIDQLEMWKIYQENWCEHNPSITVSVRDREWPEVGAWVWNNFDIVSGVSFLPHEDHIYAQAPYQECSSLEYQLALDKMPIKIDWTKLSMYEDDDNTISSQTFACSGNVCDIVDIGRN